MLKDEDYVLFSIEKILLFVHETFFQYFEEKKEICDVSKILQSKLKSILHKNEFIFSSLFPKGVDVFFTYEGKLIDYLGGVLNDEEPTETKSFILTKDYKCNYLYFILDTPKIKKAVELRNPILNINWLKFCFMYHVNIDYSDFVLSKDRPILLDQYLHPLTIFEKNKDKIEELYNLKQVPDFIRILLTNKDEDEF